MFHLLILSCQIVIRPELGSLFNCFYGLTIKYWEIRKVGWTFSHLIGSSHTYTIWNNLCQLAIADLSEQKNPCGVLQGSTVFLAFSIQTSLRYPLLTLWNLIASSATLMSMSNSFPWQCHHHTTIIRSAYYHLENIGRIKGFLSKQDTEERVQASFSAGKTIVQVVGRLLFSKMLVPLWHRWIPSLLSQTICLLWPMCLHCRPQRNDLSPSDVSGQQSWSEELALLCCANCSWRGCFVSSLCKSVQSWLHWTA